MSILEELRNNKGTTSSALGKVMADRVLHGNMEILRDAVQYVNYDAKNIKSKNIRAGAAKIIELVAEKKPDLVMQYIEDIIPSLNVKEPQTRWMVITTLGYCAKLNPQSARKGIPYAKDFLREHQGLCLSAAAERYLGYIGEISAENAEAVFPILLEAYNNPLPNEIEWILEAYSKIYHQLSQKGKEIILDCANEHLNSPVPIRKKRAEKLIKLNSL